MKKKLYDFNIGDYSDFISFSNKIKINQSYTFKIYNNNIELYKKLDYINSFNPTFYGKIINDNNHYQLKGKFGYAAYTKILLNIFYIFLLLMFLFILYLTDLEYDSIILYPIIITLGILSMQIIGSIYSNKMKADVIKNIEQSIKNSSQ